MKNIFIFCFLLAFFKVSCLPRFSRFSFLRQHWPRWRQELSGRDVLCSGGNSIPERWKWCPGVVETYSLAVEIYWFSGGNGVRKRWKNEKKM
ncbi:MAG: hypothetical protein GTO45_30525 [Candidatus Aminicenantes bacterium]|nr:hypothetical protein [Candidatus Aminicenantes bacterium]NIN22508.1 hypothetical protein [Candidatus Aminicenantes bacterium]NIN46276.1 hypothetical protein [Candidatus Aminicenantes bacterium]NIN89114.1 hypothetical protein [Candidatus Aminicenantes bacterium]NIO85589.1 hypothetical protein [Candidatus Aminicenantes bacterium]